MKTEDLMTLEEALYRLEDQQMPKTRDLGSSDDESSGYWDLNTPFVKARELANNGWIEKADELWKYIDVLAPQIELNITTNYDVIGDEVDVGRFLSNEPECMVSTTVAPESSISVLVNIGVLCDVDAKYVFNRGIAIATIVHSLQSSGRSVSLTVGSASRSSNTDTGLHEIFIEIEKFGEYINPARLAYWIAHPAALRRCIFRYKEQQPEVVRNYFGFRKNEGYGRSQDFKSDKKQDSLVVIPHLRSRDTENYSSPKKAVKSLTKLFQEKDIPISILEE